MSQIWKTPLNLEGDATTTIEHGGREVLSVGLDPSGVPCVWYWAPVDFAGPVVTTTAVVLFGTGASVDDVMSVDAWGRYIGRFNYGSLVLHACERAVEL